MSATVRANSASRVTTRGKTRDGLAVLRAHGRKEREQVYVERVPMVVSRTLRVSTVSVYLSVDLRYENAAAEPGPAIAGRELGQRETDDVQRERFAGEVRVGAEVAGQVVLDVRELPIESPGAGRQATAIRPLAIAARSSGWPEPGG